MPVTKFPAMVIRRGVADKPRLPHFRSVNLSAAKLQEFESHIKKTYEGVVFELTFAHSLLVGSIIELTWIIVENRKQGVGTAIMRQLCEFADHHAADITLTPASKDDYAATTSRARLVRFYKRFDFVIDKRKPGAITAIPVLIRKPLVLAFAAGQASGPNNAG